MRRKFPRSDSDSGKLLQTLDQLGDKQLKPSESRSDIREGNLVWIDSRLNPKVCVPRKYQAAILHEFHDTPLGSHFGTDKTYAALRAQYTWPQVPWGRPILWKKLQSKVALSAPHHPKSNPYIEQGKQNVPGSPHLLL